MLNIRNKIAVTIAIIISATLFSCSHDTVFNESVEIPASGWYKNNAVSFNVMILDSLQNYDFGIIVRNSVNYRYSNLYFFLTTEFPNGNISRDTIECILADHEGRWLGKGWGSIKENDILLNSNLRFPVNGEYKFLIQQAMRVDTLSGINNIGLSIVNSD